MTAAQVVHLSVVGVDLLLGLMVVIAAARFLKSAVEGKWGEAAGFLFLGCVFGLSATTLYGIVLLGNSH